MLETTIWAKCPCIWILLDRVTSRKCFKAFAIAWWRSGVRSETMECSKKGPGLGTELFALAHGQFHRLNHYQRLLYQRTHIKFRGEHNIWCFNDIPQHSKCEYSKHIRKQTYPSSWQWLHIKYILSCLDLGKQIHPGPGVCYLLMFSTPPLFFSTHLLFIMPALLSLLLFS